MSNMAKKIKTTDSIEEVKTLEVPLIDPAATVKIKFTVAYAACVEGGIYAVSGSDAMYFIKQKVAELYNEPN